MRFKYYIPTEYSRFIEMILPVTRAGFAGFENEHQRDALRDIDWPYIATFSMRQRILPILYHNLKKNGLSGLLPDGINTSFRMKYMRIAANNLRMARRLTDVCKLFAENGVLVVPYKGPVLSQLLYDDIALRYSQDLDLLMSKEQLKEAWVLLHAVGYRPLELPGMTQKQFLSFAGYGNELSFIDDSGHAVIDLHWKISKHTRYAYDLSLCAPRLRKIEIYNQHVWCLSDEDMVLALCLNGGNDLWPHLETVLALADIIAASPALDWDLLNDMARHLRCERMLLLGLFLAADIFDTDLPGEIRKKISDDRAVPGLVHRVYQGMLQDHRGYGLNGDDVDRLVWQIRIKDQWPDKIRYLLRRLFVPTKKDLKEWSIGGKSRFEIALLRQVEYIRNIWRRNNSRGKK